VFYNLIYYIGVHKETQISKLEKILGVADLLANIAYLNMHCFGLPKKLFKVSVRNSQTILIRSKGDLCVHEVDWNRLHINWGLREQGHPLFEQVQTGPFGWK
jgi:hypothetical protein